MGVHKGREDVLVSYGTKDSSLITVINTYVTLNCWGPRNYLRPKQLYVTNILLMDAQSSLHTQNIQTQIYITEPYKTFSPDSSPSIPHYKINLTDRQAHIQREEKKGLFHDCFVYM